MNIKYNPAINEEILVCPKRQYYRKIKIDWSRYDNEMRKKLKECCDIIKNYQDAKTFRKV